MECQECSLGIFEITKFFRKESVGPWIKFLQYYEVNEKEKKWFEIWKSLQAIYISLRKKMKLFKPAIAAILQEMILRNEGAISFQCYFFQHNMVYSFIFHIYIYEVGKLILLYPFYSWDTHLGCEAQLCAIIKYHSRVEVPTAAQYLLLQRWHIFRREFLVLSRFMLC